MVPIRERLTRPVPAWRVVLVALVVGVGGAFTGFATGRLNALEETSEQVAVVVRTREKVVERWHKGKDRIVYSEVVRSPDGTVTEKRSERETTKEEGGRELERQAEKTEESKKTTVSRPDWRVGVLVGATWKEPALRLGDTPLVIGVTAERRIIGPFSVGAWGTTQGAAGLSVAGEF
ncbi:MAG: hypothetical protein JNM17_13165 [Archangium sp.]|nr:hypothetical protein [Archangium sp.]